MTQSWRIAASEHLPAVLIKLLAAARRATTAAIFATEKQTHGTQTCLVTCASQRLSKKIIRCMSVE
jgi:hypothetical protein